MSSRKHSRSALRKNTLREIWRTKSRFLAILAIVGISVGFFSGLKSSSPTMLYTAEKYFVDNHLMDLRLISTVGFDEQDIQELSELDFVEEASPGYMADLLYSKDEIDNVVRVYSVPQKTDTSAHILNEPILQKGRLPKKEGECAIERYFLDMSGYHLGDTIRFNETVEGKSTSGIIRHREYKIVGLVDSPLYLTYLRGNSSIGDGTVSFYMMLPPEEFIYERYTAVYLKTKASTLTTDPFSDTYKNEIQREKKLLDDFSKRSLQRFNATTLADAQRELTDARQEYHNKKEEALTKLSDGDKKLWEGVQEYYTQISDAKKKLTDGEKELADGREKLVKGQEDYRSGLEEARKKLTDAQTQVDEGLAAYNAAKTEYDTRIDEAEKKLAAAQSAYDIQYQIFYSSTKPQAETKLSLLKAAIDLCSEGMDKAQEELDELKDSPLPSVREQAEKLEDKLKEYREKITDYQQQYDDGVRQLAEGEQQLNEAGQKLEAARTELQTQKAEGAVRLSEAKSQLDLAQGKLASGKLEYETAMTTGLLELQTAQTKLTEGEKELDKGKAELKEKSVEGMLSMKEGREQLRKGQYEAHVQLSDAEKKLADAENQLSALDNARWLIYDRDDNPGYSGLSDDAKRVDDIAQVFPVFFLLIAGLVCFTTMTRMVEERRTETGTLKALGYSGFAIARKYLVYGGTAALLGSVVGVLAGVFTLPVIIVDTYRIMYTFPPTLLQINWSSVIISSAAGLVCICGVSMLACYKDLRLTPAALMRPKAPKPGKRILLEYIRPLWKHMNFTSKVTARNLFRYKARFFMTVIGVAGCTALMVAGFGLRDSVTGIASLQYDELTKYDQVYALAEAGTAKEKAYLMSQFHADERFEHSLLAYMGWGNIKNVRSGKNPQIRIIIGEQPEEFREMFILRDRQTHQKVELPDDGIVVSERLGQVLNIKAGDNVILTLEDRPYTCRIAGFTENYAGSLGYMTPACYESLTGSDVPYSIIFTSTAANHESEEHEMANDYMKNDDIITVTSMSDQVNTMLDMVQSLDFIVLVLIICAGLLAVVVLYNLTNINIAERVREIATIKVLGFYNMETASFIYRESIVLTLTGSLAGLALGSVFASFVVEAIQMDNVMFPKVIHFSSYLFSLLLTFAFSLLVNFIMYFKMNKVSMAESLKSVE